MTPTTPAVVMSQPVCVMCTGEFAALVAALFEPSPTSIARALDVLCRPSGDELRALLATIDARLEVRTLLRLFQLAQTAATEEIRERACRTLMALYVSPDAVASQFLELSRRAVTTAAVLVAPRAEKRVVMFTTTAQQHQLSTTPTSLPLSPRPPTPTQRQSPPIGVHV